MRQIDTKEAKVKLLKELSYDEYTSLEKGPHARKCGVCGETLKTDFGEWVKLDDGSIWSLGKNCKAKILKEAATR